MIFMQATRTRGAWAEINLGALAHNVRSIRQHIEPKVKLCAVVKANAYGHGAIEVSKCALEEGADVLAVATVDEALELRAAGLTAPILILGLIPAFAVDDAVAHDITLTVADLSLAQKISGAAVRQNRTAKVHMKLETGMGRIGASVEDAAALAEAITQLPNVELEGLFSHFAAAGADEAFTRRQLELFNQAIEMISARGINIPIKHIGAAAAILEMPEAHFDMLRSGIITYGLYPAGNIKHTLKFRSVMTLKAQVLFVKRIPRGTSVGYGREFMAERDSVIATAAIGYADGYIRAYQGFHVEIKGKKAPIAGRVCMDQIMIDVTDIEGVKVGDEVTLWGSPTLTIDDAADWLHTINHEIPCLVSSRVPRVYTLDR